MSNYYEMSEKSKLAQGILLLVCQALTKAAKLGTDGASMFDSLLVTTVEAGAKRNALVAEAKAAQEKSDKFYGAQRFSDEDNMEAFRAQMAANVARADADRAEKKKVLSMSEDISKAGDPNEVW